MSLPSWECWLKYYAIYDVTDEEQSLPSWECWLKFDIYEELCDTLDVTPFVGVLIESQWSSGWILINTVTPFVGVLIESFPFFWFALTSIGHSLRGSVDWKSYIVARCIVSKWSLHSWECWLKASMSTLIQKINCHSLRGSVDWKTKICAVCADIKFTPFVGVLIEISSQHRSFNTASCHSLRGSVDWNLLGDGSNGKSV